MKLADHFLLTSSTRLAAFIGRGVEKLRVWLPPLSPAQAVLRHGLQSQSPCQCRWQRVARQRWTDHALSWLGWYPWQCTHCRIRFYLRRRF